jgi:hypothetical protein
MWWMSVALAAPVERIGLVPGCPTEETGHLSGCLLGKIGWAYAQWEDGVVDGFIASGGAVYTPHAEAVGIAMALEQMGVPPERIWLDLDALHTDENAYNGWLIAQALGAELVAVSSRSQSRGVCRFVRSWGGDCDARGLSFSRVKRVMEVHKPSLRELVVPETPEWRSIEQVEADRALEMGWERPGSGCLYTADTLRRLVGKTRIPYEPDAVAEAPNWAEWSGR